MERLERLLFSGCPVGKLHIFTLKSFEKRKGEYLSGSRAKSLFYLCFERLTGLICRAPGVRSSRFHNAAVFKLD